MAAEAGMRVNVASLLALGDDTVELLGERKDSEALAQACAGARMLRSACRSESDDLEVQMKVRDELDSLDSQRDSIEQRKEALRKMEKEMMKAQNMLSMCVSVTKIMPNFEDKDKISDIVNKNMKKLERFEFDKTTPPVDISNKLWKMV
uniref:Uncharacterized protein n=1 Tax=Oryza meridionalis TaxID=40149 RepID=A0A0E0DET5_9ORYZ